MPFLLTRRNKFTHEVELYEGVYMKRSEAKKVALEEAHPSWDFVIVDLDEIAKKNPEYKMTMSLEDAKFLGFEPGKLKVKVINKTKH